MSLRNQKNIIYLVILAIPFVILFLRSSFFTSFKLSVASTVSAPLAIISSPLKELKKIFYYHRTFNEYVRLRQEADTLRTRLIGFQELVQENNRLQQLLQFKREIIYRSVAAHVVSRDASRWNSAFIIDRGSVDGVRVGLPVVNSFGVIGKISEVGKRHSKVILLTDPQFSIACLIQRSRESALLSGSLQGLCRLSYVNSGADIKKGDLLITSKLSTLFPEGLLIGKVVKINDESELSEHEYFIEPAVSLDQIEEVLVVFEG